MNWFERRKARRIIRDVNDEITYLGETKGENHYQSARETLALKSGDCEDFSLFYLHQLLEASFEFDDYKILLGILHRESGDEIHAILKVWSDGRTYEICNVNGLKRKVKDFTVTHNLPKLAVDILMEHGS